MKTLLRAAAVVLLLTSAASSRAADVKSIAEFITTSSPVKTAEPVNINVDFPGGSMGKFLTAIGKVDGVSFNIITAGDTADFSKIELPAFALRNTNLLTLFEVLRNLFEQRGFSLNLAGGGNPNSLVCVVRSLENTKPQLAFPIQFLSFQLAPYLSEQSVDEIVGAIHTAWELEPTHGPDALHVKFHPGTTILLISGPAEGINLTRSVLAELKRDPSSKMNPRTGDAPPWAERK